MEQINADGGDFNVSLGNLLVMSKIPALMADKEYRVKLRALVMEYMANKASRAWQQ